MMSFLAIIIGVGACFQSASIAAEPPNLRDVCSEDNFAACVRYLVNDRKLSRYATYNDDLNAKLIVADMVVTELASNCTLNQLRQQPDVVANLLQVVAEGAAYNRIYAARAIECFASKDPQEVKRRMTSKDVEALRKLQKDCCDRKDAKDSQEYYQTLGQELAKIIRIAVTLPESR